MIFYKETDFIHTPIGLVPNDWEVTKISDIAEINKESRDPSRESPDAAFRYVDIESVTGSGRIKENKKTLGKEAPSRARRVIHENDLLMSTVRPYLKAFTIVPKWYDNEICSTGFAVLTSKENVDPRFLLHNLFSDNVISQCNRMMVGGQYPALNSSQVAEIKLPLPPMLEQRAIVRVLGVVDSTIELTDRLIAKTERLKKGLMQQLLTHGIEHIEYKEISIGKIPKEWEITTIGSLLTLQRGHDLPLSKRQSGKIPVIGANGIAGFHNKCMAAGPGVTIGRSGSIGKAYYVEEDYWPLNTSLYVKEFKNIYPKYAYYLFEKMDLTSRMHSGTAVPTLNRNNVHPITVAIPSTMAEQKKITEILTLTDKKIELEEIEKKKLERVKHGLMDLLLTGKVRVKMD